MSGISNISLRIIERTSGASIVVTNESAIVVPNTGSFSSSRQNKVFTLYGGVNTAHAHPGIRLTASIGVPIDITLRIGGVQLELGSFMTSYIPSTTAAVTRQSDILTIPTSGWYNNLYTTLYGEYSSSANSGYSTRVISLNDGTSANVLQIANANSGNIILQKAISGSILNSLGPAYIVGSNYRAAAAIDVNSGPLAVNNILYSNTNAGIPAVTRIQIGSQNSNSFLNGWISKAKYYPYRISNTQLQLMAQ